MEEKLQKLYIECIDELNSINIQRLGNKQQDYKDSNIEYKEAESKYKYKIQCKECNQIFYRQRLKKNFVKAYRCGKCNGKLELIENSEKATQKYNKTYYTYMLRCQDNSIYTGITTDLNRRMKEHFGKTDKCAKYTFNHTPRKLECVWESKSRGLASKLEYHIKKLSKAKKEELIEKNNLKKFLSKKIIIDNYKKCSFDTRYFF